MITAVCLHLVGLGGISAINFLCCAAIALVSALAFTPEPDVELDPSDPAIRQIYRRHRVYDWEAETNWTRFENELGHVMLTGTTNPVLHVDSSRDYPYSVDQCYVHKTPHIVTMALSVVYNNEPHIACPACGLILSIKQTRLPNAR